MAERSGTARIGPLTGMVLGETYRVNTLMSKGGMGAVYLAREMHTGQQVIVKVPRRELMTEPNVRERVLVEYSALRRISHPAVVTVFSTGQTSQGDLYLVMEYVRGPSLARRMIGAGFSVLDSLDIACSLADGLCATHRAGVVHRDLKPENILLPRRRSGSRVKVIDFGIARLEGTPRITETDQIIGTPCYMAPEHAMGARVIDSRTDVYSLGVIVYEMLSGTLPHVGKCVQELLVSHVEGNPVHLSRKPGATEVSSSFADFVMQCLQHDPDRRPSTMGEVLHRLQQEYRDVSVQSGEHLVLSSRLFRNLEETTPL